ncbi:MAG: cysteine--tRNA ligase [Candidatus Parcubacteria bacterium]|nr:MAG: cysteine--tRNA ligase [Candidatus Parcubacteria bacterium]
MEPLYLFNTLTRRKEKFKPLKDKIVTMYNCGPTVYERPHIGNLRAYIFADTLRRTLEYNGYKVKQIINITDVGHLTSDADTGEDKIEKSAREKRKTAWEIARYFEKIFKEDIKKLNIKTPFKFPRATQHIKEMIELIKILEKKGYTYKISDGIYFDTSKFKNYGILAQIKRKKLLAGARVEINPEKRNPYDFALWKFSPKDVKRQMEWRSPWGIGFPGWHIECSAMSMKYLGKTIDIHTGGIDHIDIHHTNEIAQSEAATGKKFVNYWLHVNFLKVEGEKMAKSLGNIITLEDIEKKGFQPLAFRYLVLTSHYRSEMNFTWQAMESAQNAYNLLLETISSFNLSINLYKSLFGDKRVSALGSSDLVLHNSAFKEILNIVNYDLDTPRLIAKLWEILKSDEDLKFKKIFVLEADKILGLGFKEFLAKQKLPAEIKKKVLLRERLRKEGKWQEADKIREEVLEAGYKIEDTKQGSIIKKVVVKN